MQMRMSDEEAFEHYKDPSNRTPAGRAYRVPKSALSRHVPIRFRPLTIAKAKVIAERDGMTVSSWIRGVVEREVERRMPASPETHRSGSDAWQVVRSEGSHSEARTETREWSPDGAHLAPA
jgi:hypothetical protein